MKNIRIKEIMLPIVAGAASAVLFLFFYMVHGFYPFGERSAAWCDMDQQYVPLLMELKTVFSDGSLFLGRGGGLMNFYGVFLFFISSPLSLLSLLADNSRMIWFVNILLLVKISLGAVSAEIYFRRVIPELSAAFSVIMSVMYSASGYVMMYYQNNMWLDMMIVFPLLMLSMFRLLKSGKWGMYAMFTAMCLFLNFYISFMVIVFLMMLGGGALYLCCEKEHRGDRAVKLLVGDICAALLSGAVWLPAFAQYTASGRGNSLGIVFFGGYFADNTLDKSVLLSGSSLVFAGALLILMLCRRSKGGKAVFFSVFGLLSLIGAFIEPANKLLQTGSYQAYPLRYGYIVILLVFSAVGALLSGERGGKRSVSAHVVTAAALVGFAAVAAICCYNREKLHSYARSLWVSDRDGLVLTAAGLAGAAVYFLCLRSYSKGRIGQGFAAAVMAAVMLCESFLGFGVHVAETVDNSSSFRRTAEAFEKLPDEGFVRVKAARKYYYPNYAEGFGAYSLGHYTSLTDCDFLYAMKRMGYSSHWLDMTSSGGTLLTDELLMNKYIIGKPVGENKVYRPYELSGELPVYTDPHAFGGALLSEVPPDSLLDFEKTERVAASGFIAEKLFGEAGLVEELSPDTVENAEMTEKDGRISIKLLSDEPAQLTYKIAVEGKKELYFDLFGNYSTDVREDYYDSAEVYVNSRRVLNSYPDTFTNGIADLGTFEAERLTVTVKLLKDIEVTAFGVYLYDIEASQGIASAAETVPIEVKGSEVRLKTDGGGWLYLPIAWSEGWECRVNGKETPLIKTLGALSAVEAPDGGEIILSFCPKGFKAGAILSITGVLATAVLMVIMGKRRVSEKMGAAAEKLLYGLSLFTVFVFYIAAPLVWAAVNIFFSGG